MRKVDELILRAVIPPFLLSLTVLTFVVFTREIGRLSELLITRNASLQVVGILAATIFPGILIFSLPMSFLIGLLIGLSGLSGESQITALRAGGISLRRILLPVEIVGAFVFLISAYLSLIVAPSSNDRLHSLKDSISLRQATSQVQPRVFNEQFPNIVFYLDDIGVERQMWSRVFLADNSDPKRSRIVLAQRGTWVTDTKTFFLQFHLEKGRIYEVDPEDPARDNVSVFSATDIPLELNHGDSQHAPEDASRRPLKAFEKSTAELWHGKAGITAQERREELVELHQRVALPFSVAGFSLLGLTLGITSKKGGRASGFVMSAVLVILFYNLFFGGVRLAGVGKIPPWLGAWGANIILVALGLVLLAAIERGQWFGHWLVSRRWTGRLRSLTKQLHLDAARIPIEGLDSVIDTSTRNMARFRFPKVLDLYIGRGFLTYFVLCLLACGALFVVLTLFDLLDEIIRNRIPITSVVDYFVFLTPQILLLVVPMAILLAILINFGILEKTSEVTALKAGGWSLYRISMPVFAIASFLCLGVYLMQDYILPYANIRQDSLRNVIKGRPAQTYMRPQRKWILGESNRIYNYDYYDPGNRMFVGLNMFEVDLRQQEIVRRVHAARAWIEEDSVWKLENGWIRDFSSQGEGFRTIDRAELSLPERPDYFQREIFEPKESAKLTYLELKSYINYLQQSGYNATELQIELYKKISFPLSCIVMALLGVPFSFSMGRRGAFYGITISIVVAMAYWGVFSAFEQMGAYGLLVPPLAAWAPNILFGATGLVLLLTIRT